MRTLLIALILFAFCNKISVAQTTEFYLGSTNNKSDTSLAFGVLDEKTGILKLNNMLSTGTNPGYIALSEDKKYLYTTSNEAYDNNEKVNKLKAFAIKDNGASLNFLNEVSVNGSNPCHISIAPNRKTVLSANYSSGSINAYTLASDGSFDQQVYFKEYKADSNIKKETVSHAHYFNSTQDGKYAYVADLGTDRINGYKILSNGSIEPNTVQNFLSVKSGSGPRHMAFHKNNKFIFILNELDATVISCAYNSSNGKLSIIDTQPTLANPVDKNFPAAIRIAPNGKYLYASNRGANCLSVFRIKGDGSLKLIQQYYDNISRVRDFNITPSGKFIIAGNEDTNEVLLIDVDKKGKLSSTNQHFNMANPSCVAFY